MFLDFGLEIVNSRIMNHLCPLQDKCSGCDSLHLSPEAQRQLKRQEFENQMGLNQSALEYHWFGAHALRSRLDFVIGNGKIGLYQKANSEIVDIEKCLQLESALQEFYSDFRKISWPIKKGSVRLRVSPSGKRGAWLDFANADIKELLGQEKSLLQLQEIAFVEIGQKHKNLIRKTTGELGLGEPVFNSWFQTWMGEESISLYSTVANFTQPSHIANKGITQILSKWFQETKPQKVLEFGSGIGNLTFPALSAKETSVIATDRDEKALGGLKYSLEKNKFQDRVQIYSGDFRSKKLETKNIDVLLLNPARNGVGKFLENLLPLKPQHIVYMSCYPESFFMDIQNLKDYSTQKVHLIDQFPNTKHLEILAIFTRRP